MMHFDVINGVYILPDEVVAIVQTPAFQRLKKIKQLGMLFCVFPEALGTRYDHCIGTFFNAAVLLSLLMTAMKEDGLKRLPPMLQDAVLVAALLHDIGHGPFSHTWEYVVEDFNHEKNALRIVDHIFKELDTNILMSLRAHNNLGVEIVKSLILGDRYYLKKRVPKCYSFIYEIVNNTFNKVDVDKWDYLKRDVHYLGKHSPIGVGSIDILFLAARVTPDGHHISYDYRNYKRIYALFEARVVMHAKCYRVPRAIACNYLLKEILQDLMKAPQRDRRYHTNWLKVNSQNMKKFLKLHDDTIWDAIKGSNLRKFLENSHRIEVLGDAGASKLKCQTAEKACSSYLFTEATELIGAGQEMPADDKFFFHGNPDDKVAIKRDMLTLNLRGTFYLQGL